MGSSFMVWCRRNDDEIIALEESDDDEVEAPKLKEKRVNAFMDGDSDALTTMQMIQKTKTHTKQIQLFHMMMKIQMIGKNEVGGLWMQESTRSPDDREDADLNEEDDEFSDVDAETSEEE